MVMSKAFDVGWDAHQPIALPDFDLLKLAGRGLAREYLQEVDPDLLILSFPCTEWSPLQQINQRTPIQIRQLHRRRREQLHLLAFVNEMSQWQASRGRAILVENPERSRAWNTAPMKAMCMHQRINETVTDMCCYNKRKPDTGNLVKKPTKLCGTRDESSMRWNP